MISQALEYSDDQSFHSRLKESLLTHHLDIIYQFLKPQMGGFIDKQSISVSILSSKIIEETLELKCSIFFSEHIGGCNCHDDPHSENGYCEAVFNWEKESLKINLGSYN